MADGFGTQDILTGRGLGLFGFGYPGYGYGGYGYAPVTNPSATFVQNDATQALLGAHDARQADQSMCTREVIASDVEDARNAFDALAIDNKFAAQTATMNSGFNRLNDANLQNVITGGQAALFNERRQSDLFMNLNNQINDFRAESAKCCCDTKILVIEENNRTRELINQRALEDANRALEQSERSRDTDRIIAAIQASNGNGNGVTCL